MTYTMTYIMNNTMNNKTRPPEEILSNTNSIPETLILRDATILHAARHGTYNISMATTTPEAFRI